MLLEIVVEGSCISLVVRVQGSDPASNISLSSRGFRGLRFSAVWGLGRFGLEDS